MSELAKTLILMGIVFVAVGLILLVAQRLGLGRFPGDIVFSRGSVRVHILLGTSVLISALATALLWLLRR